MTAPVTAKPRGRGERIPGAHSTVPEQLSHWRFNMRPRFVVIAELIAAAIIVVSAPRLWWVPLLIAAGVLLVVTVTYRGVTAAGWVRRALRYWRYRVSASAREQRSVEPEPFTAELPGGGAVGMRWDGKYLVTMIALHGRSFAPTVLVPAGAETVDTVPLEAIGALLHQFADIKLNSVDVVSSSQRVAPDGRYTPKYEEIISDRPADGERRTWLTLRLCPQACLAAMVYRGDVAAAVAVATERVRQAVLRAGCRASTCSAEQLGEASKALLAEQSLVRVNEAWSHSSIDAEYVTSYRIAGNALTNRMLNDLCTVRSTRTVQTIRLTADATGVVSVSAMVRFHTKTALTHPPLLALQSVPGEAFDAVAASLPLGDRALRLQLSPRPLADSGLRIPVGPAGPLFGMTRTGFPFLMPITDPLRTVRVAVNADLPVVAALLLRASAAGSVVLVHTDRPKRWEPISDGVRLSVAGAGEPRRTPNMIVVDGAGQDITGGERGQTVITLTDTPPPDSDIVITQDSAESLTMRTPMVGMVRLTIMRPRNEAAVLAYMRRPS
jgi:type VII secretion protein EccE